MDQHTSHSYDMQAVVVLACKYLSCSCCDQEKENESQILETHDET